MIPIQTNIQWKLIGSAVGILAMLAALGWLIHSRDSWRDTARANEQLYHSEQMAHRNTVANYRASAEQARKLDVANVARVKAEQAIINERTSDEYEARIADARARALRLQAGPTATNPSGPSAAPVSSVPKGTSGTTPPASQDGFPVADRLIATEQAIQLDELIRWVNAQSAVEVSK